MSDKPTCFVIQPFCEPYHKRFNEIYKLAIEAAGCVAQRAGGAGSDIITQEIRDNIRNSDICFAEISLDNPNVWYEVGFAHACKKQITMVCNTDVRELGDLPFDVRNRNVIGYINSADTDKSVRKEFRNKISEDIVVKLKKSNDNLLSEHSSDEEDDAAEQFIDENLNICDIEVLKEIVKYYMINRTVYKHSDLMLSTNLMHNMFDISASVKKLQTEEYVIYTYGPESTEKLMTVSLTLKKELQYGYEPTDKAIKFARSHIHLFQ